MLYRAVHLDAMSMLCMTKVAWFSTLLCVVTHPSRQPYLYQKLVNDKLKLIFGFTTFLYASLPFKKTRNNFKRYGFHNCSNPNALNITLTNYVSLSLCTSCNILTPISSHTEVTFQPRYIYDF